MVMDVACPTWEVLLDQLASFFAAPADPFVPDTLVVPSFGHGRYIAQHLSTHQGADGFGVCAGIQMLTPKQLAAQLLDAGPDNPWAGQAFSLAIADLLEPGAPWCPPGVPAHDYSFADHVAKLFGGYQRRSPVMLAHWDNLEDLGADGQKLPASQAWQPLLWRALVDALHPIAHPASARMQAARRIGEVVGRVAAVLVRPPDPIDQPLFDALIDADAPVFTLRHGPDDSWPRYGTAWPWPWRSAGQLPNDSGANLLQSAQRSATGRRQTGLRQVDDSFQIHVSHGPSRQVEVLRDVLCAAFDEVAGLQPRDVLVLCPDGQTYAPLVDNAFAPTSNHPAHQLRVRVTQQRRNPVVDAWVSALNLAAGRATADDLLSWCRRPMVARQFGFGPDNLDRLDDLIKQAGVLWGIDKGQRANSGVPVRAGTWLDGVQRLTVALATSQPVSDYAPAPADGVSLEDADLVGALSELVSRLRRAVLSLAQPTTLGLWADRLDQISADLLAVDPADAWPVEAANALLAKWRRNQASTTLSARDMSAILGEYLDSWGRPSDGNGALQVRRLGDLQGVSFRVVCLLGLDDTTFPPRPGSWADDLLGQSTGNGVDERQLSRLALRDALLSASDRFIVISQGVDERTGAALPAPIPIMDLLSLCDVPGTTGAWSPDPQDGLAIVRRHALQPYAWSNYAQEGDVPPSSYDQHGLGAARKLMQGPPIAPAPPWSTLSGAKGLGEAISLDDIESFLANPARFLLRQACRLQLPDITAVGGDRLPDQLDALGRWNIGQAILTDLLAGFSPRSAGAKALARPECPPGQLGVQAVNALMGQASALASAAAAIGEVGDSVVVDLSWPKCHLTGSVAQRGGAVVIARFGRLKALQLATCWVRLLAVAAMGRDTGQQLYGHVLSSGGHRRLLAPPPEQAMDILGQLVGLARTGATQLVPLPIETSAGLAGVFGPDLSADDAFAGRFGEGHNPAWAMLLPEVSLAALRQVGPPGVDELAAWLWPTIIASFQPPPNRQETPADDQERP